MRCCRKVAWLLPLVLLCLLLPGCFTSMLWGSDLDDTSLTDEATYRRDKEFSVWTRILLTPFAIILDIITAPVQDFFADEDDDCEPLPE